MTQQRTSNRLFIPLVLLVLVAVNWAASRWHARIDLTNEKRFTLSNSTRELLNQLDEPVTIEVFLKGNFPSGFRKLSGAVTDVLHEFREVAGNKLELKFIAPEENFPDTDITYGDSLSALQMYPINLTSQLKEGQQQQLVYPWAFVHYKESSMPVALYNGKSAMISHDELNSAEAMLEYHFADAIARLSVDKRPVVGYATGNGQPMGANVYDLVENVLKTDYNLVTFNLLEQPVIPSEISALLVVKPTIPFTPEQKLKLDQYVMNGGKLLMFIDRLEAEMDSLQIKNEVIAYDRGLELNDLVFKYGARINADLLMDLQCDYLPFDVNGNQQFELLPWNYFPVLESPGNHPVNKNMGLVAARFINSMDTVEAEGIQKTILLSSSANSRTIATPALISGKENVNAPEDERFRKSNIPVAVLLEGRFTSLYANRLSNAMRDSLQKYNATFLPRCLHDNKIILVSDGDMVLNDVVRGDQPIPMGMNPYTFESQRAYPFANRDFVRNALEYLLDVYQLSEAKGKDYQLRLLDAKRVADEKTRWQLFNIALPVCIVIVFAIFFQWNRKRRFSKLN
ncbi:MAG TPA: gliding motility-associated ABC transporter substrate-binding protein GldG [Ferruginibacter sp.]|nr:gliding motility-associated ABC transporter substrate-binding protein GldG [Ferruginibacter sp.]HRO16968.1 gliding motility-associated ABC transporter substrate-binding protein GldG [Ferruginibacter sp.]HRQ20739.1 gliding motility-associated ABC transporter substrate-binding protein GldG [Ferruginibacter sp.]